MRIGIVTGEYPPMQGGVGAYTKILAHELARQGQHVALFCSQNTNQDDLPMTKTVRHWNMHSLRKIGQWAKHERLDVLNLQFQTAAFQMSPWIHFLPNTVRDIPIVTTFHDLRFPYLFPKAGKLRNWIVMHLARASSGIIVTNHEDAASIQHLPNTALIPIGSNIPLAAASDFDAQVWRTRAGAAPNDFLVAFFGFINRSKGLDILLNSLSALRREEVPMRLLLIGDATGSSDPTNHAYAAEIEQRMDRLALKAYIHRTGFVDEPSVSAYLRASDVVALPFLDGASYRRGTLMAAIQHGSPIVTTTPKVEISNFVNGENMLLVPPNDEVALAYAIRRLHNNAQLRQRIQAGACELAARFDWSQIASDTLTFFERVMMQSRTGAPV